MTSDRFGKLAERHRGEILAYLVRVLGDGAEAQDVCQDSFLRAYHAFGRLAPDANVRAWLYKIATRVALNAMRRRSRTRARMADVDPDTLATRSVVALDQRAQLRRVHCAVDTLPPKQRAALMQRMFEGLEYDDIAASLGCTPTAARANVYQAIKKLRRMLVP